MNRIDRHWRRIDRLIQAALENALHGDGREKIIDQMADSFARAMRGSDY